jgi:hypothetical protein
MSDVVRCPHCRTELPERATFCAACGRRIEGWKVPGDTTPAGGTASLPGGDDQTRQMNPSPSLLRLAALTLRRGIKKEARKRVKKGGKPPRRRALLTLYISLFVVAAGGGVAGFFAVRRLRVQSIVPPLAISEPPPAQPLLMPLPSGVPANPPKTLVRSAKTGKKAHVITAAPVAVKAPKSSSGGLPHKTVATDSKPLTMPTVQHETTSSAEPKSEAEEKREAEARLDADSVRLVVRQHLPQVRACYSRAFKDSSPGGSVEIGFAIDAQGRAKNVRTETNTTDSEAVAKCLEQRVREWQFPRPVGGDYELIYPFVFAPGS